MLKKKYNTFLIISLIALINFNACSQNTKPERITQNRIIVGAERTSLYLNLLNNKRIAVVANPSSLINNTHLIDTLISSGINVIKVMSPEHGFRGNASAGEHIKNSTDKKSSLPIISLYGSHKKPTAEDLQNVDVLIFDLQDVGTRFYTYLSTLHLCMEACAENNKQMIILDRPNPNGYYVDGPILNPKYKSFVGMDPIPIVHGMTLGEYAQMLNGEHWLKDSLECSLIIIKIKNYNHKMCYKLKVRPSPNLPNNIAINLYPSLCLFEGTPISIGRGTSKPFQMYGSPFFKEYDTTFTPTSIPHISNRPKLQNKKCNGYSLTYYNDSIAKHKSKIELKWLINAYNQYPEKNNFFNSFFYKLAGTKTLSQQIAEGRSEEYIRNSWKNGIEKFKKIRRKYLLYPDFE